MYVNGIKLYRFKFETSHISGGVIGEGVLMGATQAVTVSTSNTRERKWLEWLNKGKYFNRAENSDLQEHVHQNTEGICFGRDY